MRSYPTHLVMMMECNWLINNLGFECRPVQGRNQGSVLEVDTSFSFSDGEPVAFYVTEHGKALVLSDNGDTLAHLMSVGLSVGDKRRWASIRNRLEMHKMGITEEGEIRAAGSKDDASGLITRYIEGILSVISYERESLSAPIDTNTFIEEVAMLLRQWKPKAELVMNPKVKGLSRREHSFDFQLDNLLIDAINPNASATGGVMRKAGDVMSSPFSSGREVMVVIDDRMDGASAAMERGIVSSLVKAVLYTDLERRGSASTTSH